MKISILRKSLVKVLSRKVQRVCLLCRREKKMKSSDLPQRHKMQQVHEEDLNNSLLD